jgi:hypothetical protein
MIAGWIIALAGFALLVYGAAVAAVFSVAKLSFARVTATETFRNAQNSNVVKLGDNVVERVIDKIPFGFLREMIRRRIGAGGSAFALSMLEDALSDARNAALRTGAFGLAICVLSYWAGPWLTKTLSNLFGFGSA